MAGPHLPQPAPVPERSGAVRQGADPEALLRQALRAQVGGPKGASRGGHAPDGAPDEPRMTSFGRLTTVQILLIAAILGLVLGMGVAFAVVVG